MLILPHMQALAHPLRVILIRAPVAGLARSGLPLAWAPTQDLFWPMILRKGPRAQPVRDHRLEEFASRPQKSHLAPRGACGLRTV